MARGMGGHHRTEGKTPIWLTPPEIIERLGPFDTDPCAAPEPRPWPTAARHIVEAENGLIARWDGRVWLNPPYGPPNVVLPWMRRMVGHGQGTALIFARTETALFFETVWGFATAILFFRGRLHFHRPDGVRAEENGGAPSALIAYGQFDADKLAHSGLDGAFVPLRLPRAYLVLALEASWREALIEWARGLDGPVVVDDLYRAFATHPKAKRNRNWRAKLRQTLQRGPFRRSAPATWELMV